MVASLKRASDEKGHPGRGGGGLPFDDQSDGAPGAEYGCLLGVGADGQNCRRDTSAAQPRAGVV